MSPTKPPIDHAKLDRIVAQARRDAEQRDKGYRERALKMYPWICGRCAREFTRANLSELTVHCHNNERSRYADSTGEAAATAEEKVAAATSNPFAGLRGLLKDKQ